MNSRAPLFLMLLTVAAFLTSACQSPSQRVDSESAFMSAPLDPSRDLLVTIRFAGRDNIDRYYYASQAVTRVFLEAGNWTLEIRRWSGNVGSDDAQRLDLNIVSWKQEIPDRIDCLVSASIRNSAGVRIDLGSFNGSAYGLTTALGSDAVNEIYVKAAQEAIAKAYGRMEAYRSR